MYAKPADPVLTEIYDLLYYLGLTATSTCFFHTSYAVKLAYQQPERLKYASKWIYPDVAKRYHTEWYCIEEDIRDVIGYIWDTSQGPLLKLMGEPVCRQPSPVQFLAVLSGAISNRPRPAA